MILSAGRIENSVKSIVTFFPLVHLLVKTVETVDKSFNS